MNHTLAEWVALAEGTNLAHAAILSQIEETHQTEEQIRKMMLSSF